MSLTTEKLCLIALKIDAKFEGKVTCAFKNENCQIFTDSKIAILESEMAELNQNKNSKQTRLAK